MKTKREVKSIPFTVEELRHDDVAPDTCNCDICKRIRKHYKITKYWDPEKGWVEYEK